MFESRWGRQSYNQPWLRTRTGTKVALELLFFTDESRFRSVQVLNALSMVNANATHISIQTHTGMTLVQ